MGYQSTKETAAKWGISKTRVIVLAKEGRIPGATLVGNSWMIPDDAQRPTDRRTKSERGSGGTYKFPLFSFCQMEDPDFLGSLSPQERELLRGQLAFESGEYETSYQILSTLLMQTEDLYVQIGSLYYLCLAAIVTCNPEAFHSSISKLQELFRTDFPGRQDLSTIFADIDSFHLGNNAFLTRFHIDSKHTYDPSTLPYLTLQAFYQEGLISLLGTGLPMKYGKIITCQQYENAHYYLVAQRMHLYLAFSYINTKETEEVLFHLKNAIRLGIEHNSYHILAYFYRLFPFFYHEIVTEFEEPILERLEKLSETLQKNVTSFPGPSSIKFSKILSLTPEEMELMYYAIKGYTNKEVSDRIGQPEYTIRRKYEKLLLRFNVSQKKSLASLFIKLLAEGFEE